MTNNSNYSFPIVSDDPKKRRPGLGRHPRFVRQRRRSTGIGVVIKTPDLVPTAMTAAIATSSRVTVTEKPTTVTVTSIASVPIGDSACLRVPDVAHVMDAEIGDLADAASDAIDAATVGGDNDAVLQAISDRVKQCRSELAVSVFAHPCSSNSAG